MARVPTSEPNLVVLRQSLPMRSVKFRWLALLIPVALCGTSCSSPAAPRAGSARPGQSGRQAVTTLIPPVTAQPAPTGPVCSSGTITVRALPGGQPTPACVTVGSTIVMTGGNDASGGTWPGPPTISDGQVLALVSSAATGASFTATLRANRPGSASVNVAFVPGRDACHPTPCTPVPGAPLILDVTVVG